MDRDFSGPARIAGSAGTGKTVVAPHRAMRHVREDPDAKVLLTTFAEPLADALRRNVKVLAGPDAALLDRISVASFRGIAEELYMLACVPELRFVASIVPDGLNALFFAGDLGQRIFQPPFSWKGLGIDVCGRSSMLKVNYRTSHQIRAAADRLLPKSVRDVDGLEDGRAGAVSVFNGQPAAAGADRRG